MNRAGPHAGRHTLAAALAALLGCLNLPARAETYWVDGYELEVSLGPARTAFVLGEPVMLNLKFENRTATDLELLLSGEREGDGWPDDFDQVLGALAKYESEEAFGGLRLAASDADEDFRTVAAQLASQSRHPKARALLLSLRTDPYYGVRLMVLNALEAWDTPQARKLIWEMTNDEHPMVREEALRFLQERAGHPPRKER